MPRNQILVRRLSHSRLLVLHPILLGEALDLPMPEHRQTRQRRQQRAHAEVFVPCAELVDRRPLIRIAHEVHIPLQDVWIELDRLLQVRLRYFAFSSSRSMFINAELYTRCIPSVRTK